MTEKERLNEILREITLAARELEAYSSALNALYYNTFNPEIDRIYSASMKIKELVESITETDDGLTPIEQMSLEVRELIYSKYPEYAYKYEGELLHSPEYIYDIAELICNEQEAGQ